MIYVAKVVLVTGASRGIGKAISKVYASRGYNVVINYANSYDRALELKDELEKDYNIKVLLVKCDVSNEDEVKEMIKLIIDNFNRLDVVVNNAGICIDSTLEDKSVSNFKRILDVNLIGTFLVSKYSYEVMESGSIVNISSTNGIDSYYPFSMDYDASKAGINILTKDLAVEFAPKVRVNAVAPGWVDTEMNELLDVDFINKELEKITVGRFAEPEEIARVVYFLSSEDASYINGEVIKVDGGRK